jgi:hypothetical protein
MTYFSKSLCCILALLLLLSACRSVQVTTGGDGAVTLLTAEDSAKAIFCDSLTDAFYNIVEIKVNERNSNKVKTGVSYEGIPILFRVKTVGGDLQHIEVSQQDFKVRTINKEKGIYSFIPPVNADWIDIDVRDTMTNIRFVKTLAIKPIPVPTAYASVHRERFNPNVNGIYTASAFRSIDFLRIDFDNLDLKVLCQPRAFKLTRINAENGKQEVVFKDGIGGGLSPDMILLIQKAEVGDMYIFSEIITECSRFPVRDIIYILQ